MASPFGNACQPIEFAGGHLGHFFQMRFEIITYQAGFDSAIRRFDPSRPSHIQVIDFII
ncbi:hypothetical protein [Bradyrhizobium septentrionale]|uniref:Uncharacterized protein n=1 Tax=Bradyrhizobium septentrionale TaxID=1404411 RepID=A0ABZ2NT89_9BRAD